MAYNIDVEEKVREIVREYTSNHNFDKRKTEKHVYSGASTEDEVEAEIEASGLFELIEKVKYVQEIKNDADQYLKVIKSIPAFASILDGLNDRIIENMDNEIGEVINKYGGYVSTLFNFSLYITRKRDKF